MTAQIDDLFRHEGTDFRVAGISEGELFDPGLLGLSSAGTCSACWRGYQAIFAVSGSRLVLDTLHVNLVAEGGGYERLEGPPINGVVPAGPRGEGDWFNNHYEGLEYHLEYSGGLLLADRFIDELYVHMGFHPAWKYEKVIELVFANGNLAHRFDRSDRVAEIRRRVLEARAESGPSEWLPEEKIREFIERSFDRTYGMWW